jgi:hypothetical protein
MIVVINEDFFEKSSFLCLVWLSSYLKISIIIRNIIDFIFHFQTSARCGRSFKKEPEYTLYYLKNSLLTADEKSQIFIVACCCGISQKIMNINVVYWKVIYPFEKKKKNF